MSRQVLLNETQSSYNSRKVDPAGDYRGAAFAIVVHVQWIVLSGY
jgi:hypothetical protein